MGNNSSEKGHITVYAEAHNHTLQAGTGVERSSGEKGHFWAETNSHTPYDGMTSRQRPFFNERSPPHQHMRGKSLDFFGL